MEPLAALGACSSILQIIDFSCKILSKGNQLRNSFSGATTENVQFEQVGVHLKNLVLRLRQNPVTQSQSHGGAQAQGLDGMITLCIQTTDELIEALEKLKVQGKRTRWKSFRQAVKSVWRKEKIDDTVSRLQMIRDEIEFGVIIDLKDSLFALSTQQSSRFNDLDQSTKAVLQAVLSGQSASTAASQSQMRAIEDMSSGLERLVIDQHQQTQDRIIDELRQYSTQSYTRGGVSPIYLPHQPPEEEKKTDILVMLKFVAIDDRHGAIADAHRRTFEWVWSDQSPTGQPWSSFWRWLTVEQGIFWISGKAGSGKSTLMKYVYHDERTEQGLGYWANQTKVVKAGFFFWNSGSAMQKSLMGLLQSILYEILQQRPDLKDTVFPERIQTEVSERFKSRSSDVETVWTVADLKAAFDRLLRIPVLRICLFIDGLDEYEGSHQEISELFKGIMTSPSVKACLSSRPLVVFDHAFSTGPRLRLQDLTYGDISLYVREKLQNRNEVNRLSLSEPSEFRHLVEDIIEKAAGVFLWVTLAVRSLLEGLTNYDRLSDLRLRLKEIPDDLSHLYWHMLQGIKPAFYFSQAARLLTIMHVAYTEEIAIDGAFLSFAEEYEIGAPLRQIVTPQELTLTRENMKGRLMSRCRGLLEVHRDTGAVSFLHQSVADFLMQPDVKKSLDDRIKGPFSPYSSIIAAHLTLMKMSTESDDRMYLSELGQSRINQLFNFTMKAEEQLGQANIALTNDLDEIVGNLVMECKSSADWKHWSYRDSVLSWAGIIARTNRPRPPAWNDTFISYCLQNGVTRYVVSMLDDGEPLHQGPEKRPLLDFIIHIDCVLKWAPHARLKKLGEMCRLVLDRGANPNEEFRGRTVWENLLYYADGGYGHSDATFSYNFPLDYPNLPYDSIWLELMKIFLQYGADPNAGLIVFNTISETDTITPAALFIKKKFMPKDRRRGAEVYNMLISLGGTEAVYSRPSKPWPSSIIFDLLPKPPPESIPPRAPFGDLNNFDPPWKPSRKPLRTPDYEGLIPVLSNVDRPSGSVAIVEQVRESSSYMPTSSGERNQHPYTQPPVGQVPAQLYPPAAVSMYNQSPIPQHISPAPAAAPVKQYIQQTDAPAAPYMGPNQINLSPSPVPKYTYYPPVSTNNVYQKPQPSSYPVQTPPVQYLPAPNYPPHGYPTSTPSHVHQNLPHATPNSTHYPQYTSHSGQAIQWIPSPPPPNNNTSPLVPSQGILTQAQGEHWATGTPLPPSSSSNYSHITFVPQQGYLTQTHDGHWASVTPLPPLSSPNSNTLPPPPQGIHPVQQQYDPHKVYTAPQGRRYDYPAAPQGPASGYGQY